MVKPALETLAEMVAQAAEQNLKMFEITWKKQDIIITKLQALEAKQKNG